MHFLCGVQMLLGYVNTGFRNTWDQQYVMKYQSPDFNTVFYTTCGHLQKKNKF